MIDDDRPSRQSMRCRAALRARGEPPRRLGARPCKCSSFPALTTRGSLGSGRSRLQCRRRLWIIDGRGHGSSKTRDAAISREFRLRGGNFPCCKALKNLKTRKFFAVIAERPVFPNSTGIRAVGYRDASPLLSKAAYATAAVPWVAAREGLTAERSGPQSDKIRRLTI